MSKYFLFIFTLFGLLFLAPPIFAQSTSEAKITNIVSEGDNQILTIEVTKGDLVSESPLTITTSPQFGDYVFEVGQRVLVSSQIDPLNQQTIYRVEDYIRYDGIFLITLIFLIVVLFVARLYGITSVLGMVYSFFIIFKFTLPNILAGRDPILFSVLSAIIILPVTFVLSHGFNKKTLIALVATLFSIIFVGILAIIFSDLTYLTGTSNEEASFVAALYGQQINLKNLLLAGIIIASMGILDDVAVSQVAIVEQLSQAMEKPKFTVLFTRAMSVGRDHVSSMINTLILVYAGSSLPLLILFTNSELTVLQAINYQLIAEEIVKTLVGSIALMICVPISTFLAAKSFSKKP